MIPNWCQITQQSLTSKNDQNTYQKTASTACFTYKGMVVWIHLKLERYLQADIMNEEPKA